MSRMVRAAKASPRKAMVALASVVVAAGAVIGSGAVFTSTTSNPNNTFTAGNLTHSNSKDGAAILTASNLLPGGSSTGTVDITNTGNAAGSFSLQKSNLTDTPATPAFSGVLTLKVEDCGTPGGAAGSCTPTATVYNGTLAGMGTQALGTYAAGAAHRYRFTVTFPDGGTPSGPNSGDNRYKDASTSVQFDWQSVTS